MFKKFKIAALLASTLAIAAPVYAEDSMTEWLFSIDRMKGVKPVTDKRYAKECGDCHFAYQPGLLPGKSWEKLMAADALKHHFGENAELDPATRAAILNYLLNNAAETSWYKRSRKIAVATEQGPAPLRITELRYISRVHQHIPEKMIKDNKEVRSLSMCNACHTQATQGVYDSDTVNIPNYPGYN